MWLGPDPDRAAVPVDDLSLVTDWYTDLAAGALDRVRPVLAPDFMMRIPARLPWGGSYYGPDGFFEFHLRRLSCLDTRLQTAHLFDAGGRIVQVGTLIGTIRPTDIPVRSSQIDIVTLRNGQITRYTTLLDAPVVLAALARADLR
ncbi:nuclear transport factor 2 family protein [Nocardia sp. NPDC059240]|uniref:nuclear transport factor 2 family protein n=1 Tax=Nocardia sp. NPDC059240 TaxID=3346786 RepID=UPI0036D1D6B1